MLNFPTPHCHIQSLDSASTPEQFIKREKELGTGVITCTDHGTMGACRHVYDLAKKNKLTPILGIEAYFRDDNCPILLAAGKDPKTYAKYFHITLHALDQDGYEALVRVLSRTALTRMERHGSEEKPLFNWADLEELAKFNITFTTGCLVGMVQRHLIMGEKELALAYANKLKSMVKEGNLYIEIFPHKTDKQWVSGVTISLADGRSLKYYKGKTVKVNGEDIIVTDLVKKWDKKTEPFILENVKHYGKYDPNFIKSEITKVELIEAFIENECIPGTTDPDTQKFTNFFMWGLSLPTGLNVPALISDDAHFAYPEEKPLQDIKLGIGGEFRFYESYHRRSSEEAYEYFKKELNVDEEQFQKWIQNNVDWANRFKDFMFVDRRKLPTRFYPNDTLAHTKTLIDKHGRMNWNDAKYVERLKAELTMLMNNGTVDLLPYFFVCEEALDQYATRGLLTGPGRGSAAGLLLSYLLGITHVDPLKYNLSMERFLTLDRIKNGKWPDIDMDLPYRDILIDPVDPSKGWLNDRFGECVAQISTDTKLKIRSSIKDVARVRYGGKVPKEIDKLAHNISTAPQGIEDHDFVFGYKGAGDERVPGSIEWDVFLQEYANTYPEQWNIVQQLLGLTRQKSRHACAYVITDEPVSNFIPLTRIGKHKVTQYTAKSVEASGGLKMDFLVINILNDISKAIKLIHKKLPSTPNAIEKDGKVIPPYRIVPHNGQLYDIWDLPTDMEVYKDICNQETETVFQLNTPGARQYLRLFNGAVPGLTSIEDLAAFTSLDRPGPLDAYVEDPLSGRKHNMLVEFSKRATGQGSIGSLAVLDELLPETHGIIVYQEQLQRIFQVIGKTTAIQADDFRIHIGKKMMADVVNDEQIFMPGAIESVGEETAKALWNQMFTFGQYGFNKSHAICYVTISYACAWLKHHFPLEWWTAVLSNADRNEIDEKFWKHCGHLVKVPDIAVSGSDFVIEGKFIRAPLSMLRGIGEKAHQEIIQNRGTEPFKDIRDFVQRWHNSRLSGATITKDKKGKDKVKLPHSALHRGVVQRLIMSGAMDSLFSEETDIFDKLMAYETARAEVTGKKQENVDPIFSEMGPLMRYQLKKSILPAYTQELLPLLQKRHNSIKEIAGIYYWNFGEDYRFVSNKEFERLDTIRSLPVPIMPAIAGYVVAERRFKYGGNKEACEVTIDNNGQLIKAIKWPGDTGKLPKDFKEDITGSIAIFILSRKNDKKDLAGPWTIYTMETIQPPLNLEEKEESK